jgi:anti-sigma B factor antagonist
MSFSITKKEIEGTVVLELVGRLFSDGGAELRELVRSLLQQQKLRIVVDVSEMTYMDSSGLGELVGCYTLVRNAKGRFTLCRPRVKVLDLLSITKLMTLMDIVSSVEEAVAEIHSEQLTFLCPVSECGTWSPIKSTATTSQHCVRCLSQTQLGLSEGSKEEKKRVSVDRVEIPTYPGESVSVVPGTPRMIEINGRLDLFALNSVRKAHRTIPNAMFNLTAVTEVSDRTAEEMVQTLASALSVVFLPNPKMFPANLVRKDRNVYTDRAEAVQAHFAEIKRRADILGFGEPSYGGSLHTFVLH